MYCKDLFTGLLTNYINQILIRSTKLALNIGHFQNPQNESPGKAVYMKMKCYLRENKPVEGIHFHMNHFTGSLRRSDKEAKSKEKTVVLV